ncbi:MAG: CvpA family protein [Candidatus Cryptobacteroides sp.]
MNLLDIILLVLFIPAIIRGISKGFIEQIVALASLFLSAWLAYLFSNTVSGWLAQYISNVSPQILYVISFVIIIIVTVALLNLLARLLSNIVKTISLGWINSLLGVVLSIVNTMLILGIILMAFKSFNESTLHLSTELLDSSIVYKAISSVTDVLFPYIENLFSQISDEGARMC